MSKKHVLTEPQRRELAALTRGPQPTFGKGRANVQRRLVSLGLAIFLAKGGSKVATSTTPEFADLCAITDAGRAAAVSGHVPVAAAKIVSVELPPKPAPTVPPLRDPRSLDALSEDSRNWKRLEDGLDDETCQALIARVRELSAFVEKVATQTHYIALSDEAKRLAGGGP